MNLVKLRDGSLHLLYDVDCLLRLLDERMGGDIVTVLREFLSDTEKADALAATQMELRAYEMRIEELRALLMDVRDMAEQQVNGKSVAARNLAKAIYDKINKEL